MNQPNFAKKYRPERFEEVYGQDHVVACLSGYIVRGQIGRNLLLHGSVGSGKTSLVRLYAKALNCVAPEEAGSPCGVCEWCGKPDRRDAGLFEYDVSGRGGDIHSILRFVNDLNRTPTECRIRVLFFDEAHSLTPDASDAILKMVEEPHERVIFCFATTEPGKMRPALVSRLFPLEVRPLPASLAIAFLRKVADNEEIACEPEALALLAGLKHGYPRDLLNGLEQLHGRGPGPITLERVRSLFDVDHTKVLVEYFLALADGDISRQTELIFAWQEPAREKVRWVQAFLTFLFYNNVLGKRVTLDALTSSIPARDRKLILDRFCERLGLQSPMDLAIAWHKMMAFWPIATFDPDEAALHLRLTLFHQLVNEELPRLARNEDSLSGSPVREADRVPLPTAARSRGFLPWHETSVGRNRRTGTTASDGAFLSVADAREIINCASFLVQEHGISFNALFKVRPWLFAAEEGAGAVQLIAEFCNDLEAEVQARSLGPFARLSLVERDPLGVRGLVLAHLPRRGTEDIEAINIWCQQWRSSERLCSSVEPVELEIDPTRETRSLDFHWRQTLKLCAGLDPNEEVWDPKSNETRPLLKLLKIAPKDRRAAGPHERFNGRLFSVSKLLDSAAIAEASRNRMEPLSAFDAGAWDWIRNHRKWWERDEHIDRQETRAEREEDIQQIVQTHGGAVEAVRLAMDELVSSWPECPEERIRSWRGWWPEAEA